MLLPVGGKVGDGEAMTTATNARVGVNGDTCINVGVGVAVLKVLVVLLVGLSGGREVGVGVIVTVGTLAIRTGVGDAVGLSVGVRVGIRVGILVAVGLTGVGVLVGIRL